MTSPKPNAHHTRPKPMKPKDAIPSPRNARSAMAWRIVAPGRRRLGDVTTPPRKTVHPIQSSSPAFQLRPATAADAPTLLSIIRKYYAHDHIAFHPREISRGLSLLLARNPPGWAWLAVSGKRTVGYAVCTRGFDYEFGGAVATITDLYLEPEFRGRGFGRMILKQIEAHCRRAGIAGLELQVERRNAPARKLYRKFGFEAADRI